MKRNITRRLLTTHESLHHHKLSKNITILGAPGSGKGFYGRPLAKYFNAPIWTVSSILRENHMDITTGHLLNDHKVSHAVHNHIQRQLSNRSYNYILDGYPRTPLQIELMEKDWLIRHQVHICLHLNVPDEVCEAKMLGRRQCKQCGKHHNTANVQFGDFDLPAQLLDPNCVGCQTEDWFVRADDTPKTIKERLRVYREYEKDILDYYKGEERLVQFTPFKGEKDLPRMFLTLKSWLHKFHAL